MSRYSRADVQGWASRFARFRLGRTRADELPGITAVARLDARTKALTKRLHRGEIAIIDHVDMDRVSAEALVGCGVRVVVNAARSISGRYPNLGPKVLVQEGITLVDDVGPDIFNKVHEGDAVRVNEGTVYLGDDVVAKGSVQTLELIEEAMTEAREGVAAQIEAFTVNTMEFLRQERDLLIDRVGVPEISTGIEGRHALIVVRGYHYREDIATLRPYIREYRPVFIGVDGGADALLEAGYKPDVIVGDMDSVTDEALTSGAELVVHAYRDGRAPGLERVHALGREGVAVPTAGTSEDIAMMLADHKGASLIVAVGTHLNLEEFLDKGRAGMSSTWLTRLRVGSKLVDAKGVSLLYRSRIKTSSLVILVVCAFLAIVLGVLVSPAGQASSPWIGDTWDRFVIWLEDLIP